MDHKDLHGINISTMAILYQMTICYPINASKASRSSYHTTTKSTQLAKPSLSQILAFGQGPDRRQSVSSSIKIIAFSHPGQPSLGLPVGHRRSAIKSSRPHGSAIHVHRSAIWVLTVGPRSIHMVGLRMDQGMISSLLHPFRHHGWLVL